MDKRRRNGLMVYTILYLQLNTIYADPPDMSQMCNKRNNTSIQTMEKYNNETAGNESGETIPVKKVKLNDQYVNIHLHT